MTCCSRRTFLRRASITALAPALNSPTSMFSAWLAQSTGPQVRFSSDPLGRISVSTYPFRDFIVGSYEQPSAASKKMPLKDFPAHVVAKFKITKIEPWSAHILSREDAYLDELRNAAEKAGISFANIAADGLHCIYSSDAEERRKAVGFGINWVDVAAHLGSPSVRLNIAESKDTKPDAAMVAEGLKQVASYAASKNVVVHLENDNPVSEDPLFVASVVDRVASPWLHTLPDFGNSFAALPAAEALRGMDQMFSRAYAISHVKNSIGETANAVVPVDVAPIFALARKHNFKGVFSMEWDTPGDVYEGTSKLIAATEQNLS